MTGLTHQEAKWISRMLSQAVAGAGGRVIPSEFVWICREGEEADGVELPTVTRLLAQYGATGRAFLRPEAAFLAERIEAAAGVVEKNQSDRPAPVGPGVAGAIRHLVQAQQLLADFDRSARGVDVAQIRAGVAHEVSAALSALQNDAVGDRVGKERGDARATSRRAARRVKVKTGTQRGRILMALAAHPEDGMTDREISAGLEIPPSSARPRRGELVDVGYVIADGVRLHEGEPWTVWRCTDAGLELARHLARQPPPVPRRRPGTQMTLA